MERWEQIESIFQEALERPASEREIYVRQACGNDAELHRDISSLVESYDDACFGPWAATAAAKLVSAPSILEPGERLGPYEILSFIAAGGMGAVYRAHDPRTGRQVAIKVSSAQFSERFEHEVRTVAALNHPNICTLYDVGPNYLVMELVEGESPKGPLPLDKALGYALQIADALEAAHEKGITHRDLKPANIKIKEDGTLKVLDFGLAASQASAEQGVIAGTVGYMSPEQTRGRTDKRADIWAFGVVLYEMLTGERITKDPDLSRVPPKTRKLLNRCLQEDPKQRLRDIGEARFLLEEEPAIERRKLPWIVTAAAVTAAAALGFVTYRHYTEPAFAPNILKVSVMLPERAILNSGSVPAMSPDGRWLAFSAIVNGQQTLWVRDLNVLGARLLPGTDGAMYPFWSPDGRWIGFFTTGGKLKKIQVTGGPAVTISDAEAGRGGTWNQNNVIVYAINGGGLFRISAEGGSAPVEVSTPDKDAGEVSHRMPWFLPDGHHVLYSARNLDPEKGRVYVADLEPADHSIDRRMVLATDSNAVYVPPGYLLFVRDRTLMAQSFDTDNIQTTGDPVPIAENVDFYGASMYAFSASKTGMVTYISGSLKAQMTWFSRAGQPLGTIGPQAEVQWVAISPDGTTVAYDHRDEQTGISDIWLHNLVANTDSRLTFGPISNQFPVWSPDGTHIAFAATRPHCPCIYQRAINSVGGDEALDAEPSLIFKRPSAWSQNYLVEIRNTNGIWLLPMKGEKKVSVYLDTEFNETAAALSPDGRWLAYTSNPSKRPEIYVETFPNRTTRWQVSVNGGSLPRWSRDGKELYFIGTDDTLMAAEIKNGPKFETGTPRPLFATRLPANGWYDVSADGRFLIPMQLESAGPVAMTVLVNWASNLKK